MTNEKAIEIAKHYYKILKHKVELFNIGGLYRNGAKPFKQFCEDLEGHNFEWWNEEKTKGLFDINYGNICATITYENGKCRLSKSVEIWNDDCFDDNYIMEEEI